MFVVLFKKFPFFVVLLGKNSHFMVLFGDVVGCAEVGPHFTSIIGEMSKFFFHLNISPMGQAKCFNAFRVSHRRNAFANFSPHVVHFA